MPVNSLTPESTSDCLAPFPIPVLVLLASSLICNSGKSLSKPTEIPDDDGNFDGQYVLLLYVGARGLGLVEVVVGGALLLFAAIHDMYV